MNMVVDSAEFVTNQSTTLGEIVDNDPTALRT